MDDLAGWAWSAIEAKWEEGFRYLRAFVQRETHALVKYTHMEDGYPLGQWVVRQRARKKRHYLKEHDPKRYKRLSKLPGWAWNANEAGWEEGFGVFGRMSMREVMLAHHRTNMTVTDCGSGSRFSAKTEPSCNGTIGAVSSDWISYLAGCGRWKMDSVAEPENRGSLSRSTRLLNGERHIWTGRVSGHRRTVVALSVDHRD